MTRPAALVLGALLLLPGCRRAEPAPEPSFADVFPPVVVELATFSSPALADLDRDGIQDIVFGSGRDRTMPGQGRYYFAKEPAIPGYVTAVSGATGQLLWKTGHAGEAHTIPRFADVSGDGVPDVFMGGREAAFAVFSGSDGKVLWQIRRDALPVTPEPYNFFTPAIISDVNGDGAADLVVVYGGNDTRLPGTPRDAAFLLVVSGRDGAVLHTYQTPDAKESYAGLVVYRRPDGKEWLYFGTGGETDSGAAYRVPLEALLDGTFATRAERLTTPGSKGVMAPPTLVELTGDQDPEIVVGAFDGRVIALNGATGQPLWEHRSDVEESYHQPAVVRMTRDGKLGLLYSSGIGVFPQYTGSVHRLFDAGNGSVIYEYRDQYSPGGAPLAVDLTGDGIDELVFFSVNYPVAQAARIHILHAPSKSLIAHDVPLNLTTTPLIGDPRRSGELELVAVAWEITPGEGPPDWRRLRTRLLRLDLDAPTPPFLAWAEYMGSNRDGTYRPPEKAAAN